MKVIMAKEKWLVTGGAGFIGSHLVKTLLNQGSEVLCIDDLSSGKIENLPKSKSLQFIKAKIQSLDSQIISDGLSGIFHLAGQVSAPMSVKNIYTSSSNNLLSMLKALEIVKIKKIPIVYASSSAVYGDKALGDDSIDSFSTLSPYAMDKLTMERYAKLAGELYNISSLGLRFFNVYGPRQDPSSPYSGVISIFLDKVFSNGKVVVNGGYQTRDFIYVKDVVNVLTKSMKFCLRNHICDKINVGTGRSITIVKLLSIISELLIVKPEVIQKELPKGDPVSSNCNINKLESTMGISVDQFYSLKEGLELTLEYIQDQKNKT